MNQIYFNHLLQQRDHRPMIENDISVLGRITGNIAQSPDGLQGRSLNELVYHQSAMLSLPVRKPIRQERISIAQSVEQLRFQPHILYDLRFPRLY
jgi:hypothetical protein